MLRFAPVPPSTLNWGWSARQYGFTLDRHWHETDSVTEARGANKLNRHDDITRHMGTISSVYHGLHAGRHEACLP